MSFAAGDDAKFRERRIGNKTLVRKDFVRLPMIDGEKTELIEINGFFHRLHEAETEHAVKWVNTGGANFEIFVRVGKVSLGNATLAGANPVADDAWADHVRDQLIFLAVPRK